MRVTPKTEKEIQESSLLPKGVYPFTIASAEEKTSKKGNEMIVVEMKVFRDDGGFVFVRDFLMDTDVGAFKLRHIAAATELLDSYESGNLDAGDLVGREGWVKIGIKKDKTGQYPDQNQAQDYYAEEPKAGVKAGESAPAGSDDPDDQIPF